MSDSTAISAPQDDIDIEKNAPVKSAGVAEDDSDPARNKKLLIYFLAMVIIGLGNNVFGVLQLVPLRNYALFSNLLTTFVYVPVSFAYIFPMIKWGSQITKEAQEVPKYKWAIMGGLDSIAGIMQSVSIAMIDNGTLVTLLKQAAIPASMIISKLFLRKRYKTSQYSGAICVGIGLLAALLPSFFGHTHSGGSHVAIWSIVLIFSCIPMCLSSVYKEKALGDVEIDAIYMNGWVAICQLVAAIPLLYPSAAAQDIKLDEVWRNVGDGARCFAGYNSITTGEHPDDCTYGPVYTSIYIVFNLAYNILIILLLKYGGSNILWLALTIMVPLSSFTFAIPFVPGHAKLTWETGLGLVLILGGLVIYRFWSSVERKYPRIANAVRCNLKHYDDADQQQKKLLDNDGLINMNEVTTSPGANTPMRGTLMHVQTQRRGPNKSINISDKQKQTNEAPY